MTTKQASKHVPKPAPFTVAGKDFDSHVNYDISDLINSLMEAKHRGYRSVHFDAGHNNIHAELQP